MKTFGITDPDFFKEEVRSGYLVPAEMKQVWACQLDLLEKLLQVCKKYGLKCWAEYGTMLGAVRHKGFIPWDDDIDMSMLREDYDRLCEVAPKEFGHPYFFQTIYSDEHYSHRHGQLRNSDTAAICERKKVYNQGIFIDIFVLDAYPSDAKQASVMIRRISTLRSELKFSQGLMKLLPDCIYRSWYLDRKFYRKFEDYMRRNNTAEADYLGTFSYAVRSKIKRKADYDETVWMDFEHLKIPVPKGYDNLLKVEFGDYMTPVQAPSGHGHPIFSTEKSYKTILKELGRK